MVCVSRDVLQKNQVRIVSCDEMGTKIGRTGRKIIKGNSKKIFQCPPFLPPNVFYPDLANSVLYMYVKQKMHTPKIVDFFMVVLTCTADSFSLFWYDILKVLGFIITILRCVLHLNYTQQQYQQCLLKHD